VIRSWLVPGFLSFAIYELVVGSYWLVTDRDTLSWKRLGATIWISLVLGVIGAIIGVIIGTIGRVLRSRRPYILGPIGCALLSLTMSAANTGKPDHSLLGDFIQLVMLSGTGVLMAWLVIRRGQSVGAKNTAPPFSGGA